MTLTKRQLGGLKAAEKNLKRDPDFYKKAGQKGGLAKVPKGFAINRDLARTAGQRGGLARGENLNILKERA